MAALEKYTVARLDEIASEQGLTEYPLEANKAEKVEYLEAALGADYDVPDRPVFVVGLADGINGVQFQAGIQHIELEAGQTYETTDALLAASLRDVPYLTVEEG